MATTSETTTAINKLDDNRFQIIKTTTIVETSDYMYDDIFDKIKALEQRKADEAAIVDTEIAKHQAVLAEADTLNIIPTNETKTLTAIVQSKASIIK